MNKLKPAIVWDLDGVVTRGELRDKYAEQIANNDYSWFGDMVAHFKPFEWSTSMIASLSTDFQILFVTARSEEFRLPTVQWIEHYIGIKNYKLLMRESNKAPDMSDDELKKSIYYEKIYGKYDVLAAFDDKKENIDMWRSLGITALHNVDEEK